MPQDKFGHDIRVNDLVISESVELLVKKIDGTSIVTIDRFGSESTFQVTVNLIVYDRPSPQYDSLKQELMSIKDKYSSKLKIKDLEHGGIYENRYGQYLYLGRGEINTDRCNCAHETRCRDITLECNDRTVVNVKGHLFLQGHTQTRTGEFTARTYGEVECVKSKTLYFKAAQRNDYLSMLQEKLANGRNNIRAIQTVIIEGKEYR